MQDPSSLPLRNSTFAKASDDPPRMTLDYVSYVVDLGQLEEAIVIRKVESLTLILWSEMRCLRASIYQNRQAYPPLGHKFEADNRGLEELTMSIPPSRKLRMDDGAADDLGAVDHFGRPLLNQRKLLKNATSSFRKIEVIRIRQLSHISTL